MKLLITILALVFAVTVNGQKSKKKMPKPPPTYGFSQTAFNLELEKLPANFKGHNFEAVFIHLIALDMADTQGEYEKTEEWKKRIANLYKQPIVGNVTMDDYFAFVVILNSTYNADDERMYCAFRKGAALPSIVAEGELTVKDPYIATNAFGISVKVERASFLEKTLIFDNLPFGFYYDVTPVDAKRIKPHIKGLLIGKIVDPYVYSFQSQVAEPTINKPLDVKLQTWGIFFEPVEAWAFDSITGHVYTKTKIKK